MKKINISLYYKALAAILAILLPILVTFLIGYKKNEENVKSFTLDSLHVLAEAYEGLTLQFLEMSKRRARDFASDGYIREQLQKIIRGEEIEAGPLRDHLVRNKMSLDSTIHAIHIVSLEGLIVGSSDTGSIGQDVSGNPYFLKGRKSAVVTENVGGIIEETELVIATPITHRVTGEPIGLLANFIRLFELNKVLSGRFFQELGADSWGRGKRKTLEVYLVNGKKLMISESKFVEDAVMRQSVDSRPVKLCLESSKEMTGFYEDYRGVKVAGASMCIPSMRWTLLLEIDTDEVLAPVKAMRREAMMAMGIVGMLIGLLFVLFNRRVVSPIRMVSEAAREIAVGNYDVTIPVDSSDELGRLSESFNRMAKDIKTTTTSFRESEARLANAQRIAHIGNWEWDVSSNKLHWYYEVYRIFGISPQDFQPSYDLFLKAIHPEDVELVQDAVKRALKNIGPFSLDHRIILPDGTERYVHEEAEVEFGEDGKPIKMIGTVQDITERRKSEEALRLSESRLKEAQQIARIGNWDWNIVNNELYWSDEIYRIFGFEPGEIEMKYDSFMACVHLDDREYVQESIDQAIKGLNEYAIDHRIILPDDRVRIVHEQGEVSFDDNGKAVRMVGTVQDVTEQRKTEFELKKLSATIDHSINLVMITDIKGKIEYVNPMFEKVTGYLKEEVIGKDPSIQSSGETTKEEYKIFWDTILSGRTWRGDFKNRKKNGEFYWINSLISPIKNDSGQITHFLAVQEDVTEKRKSEERIDYLATYDELTGLLNRTRFADEMERLIAAVEGAGGKGALLLVDIDGFRFINDTYGHLVGDQLIKRTGTILKSVLEEMKVEVKREGAGIVGRLGADEFAVFMPFMDKKAGLEVAERMRKDVEDLHITDVPEKMTVSIGVVGCPEHGTTFKDLMTKGDAALIRIREMGHNRCDLYRPEDLTLENIHSKIAWKGKIQSALEEERFELWYQPILDIKNDTVKHYEVLVRMREKDGTLSLPGSFIGVAESFGLVGSIDRFVAERTMKRQVELSREGKHITLSINLSGKDLGDEALLGFLQEKMSEVGADPSHIVFEITETEAIKELGKAVKFIKDLKSTGCHISLDDFGVGFTSFVYLRELEVDYIKIDGSFIKNLEQNHNDQIVVKSITDVAKGMKIKTVAEFVEGKETLKLLKEYGVDYAQGYFIGKPAPEIEEF